MRKIFAGIVFCLALTAGSPALALDFNSLNLPVKISFQLGFSVKMVPASNDLSAHLGLVVTPGKIYTDRHKTLTLTGTIANHSDVHRSPSMSFAVTSYTATGVNTGLASITPDVIPPGGVATFSCPITLINPRPRLAMYAVTDPSVVIVGQ